MKYSQVLNKPYLWKPFVISIWRKKLLSPKINSRNVLKLKYRGRKTNMYKSRRTRGICQEGRPCKRWKSGILEFFQLPLKSPLIFQEIQNKTQLPCFKSSFEWGPKSKKLVLTQVKFKRYKTIFFSQTSHAYQGLFCFLIAQSFSKWGHLELCFSFHSHFNWWIHKEKTFRI